MKHTCKVNIQYILCSKYPLSSSRARRQHVPLTLTVHNFRGRLCHSAESPPPPQASFTHMHTHSRTHTHCSPTSTHTSQTERDSISLPLQVLFYRSPGLPTRNRNWVEIKCFFRLTDKFKDLHQNSNPIASSNPNTQTR